MSTRTEALRPMRDLLARLPLLPMTPTHEVDFPAVDPNLLIVVAGDAETLMRVVHHGIGAIGHLLAHSAVVIEDGTVGADSIESLGFLMAELGDLAAGCMTLATQCRRETHDFQPT